MAWHAGRYRVASSLWCATEEMACRWGGQGCILSVVVCAITGTTKEMACRWISQGWSSLLTLLLVGAQLKR